MANTDKTTERLWREYLLANLEESGSSSNLPFYEAPATERASITKTITSAGTPELASETSIPCDYCFVIPISRTAGEYTANTGSVYWGVASGMVLCNIPTGGVRLSGIITNLNQLYIDSDNNNEGVLIIYATR